MDIAPLELEGIVWGTGRRLRSGRGVEAVVGVVETPRKRRRTDTRRGGGSPQKAVTFSDAVELHPEEEPSAAPSPVRTPVHLPRGILKPASDTPPETDPTPFSPGVVVTPTNPGEFTTTTLDSLTRPEFAHRFEAYASLAHMLRTGEPHALLTTAQCATLVATISSDTSTAVLSDPLRTRTVVQALRVYELLVGSTPLAPAARYPPVVTTLLERACEVAVHPDVSKALLAAYLLVVRALLQHPLDKRVGSHVHTQLVTAALDMRFFPSHLLAWERVQLLRRLLVRTPAVMAERAAEWLPLAIANAVVLAASDPASGAEDTPLAGSKVGTAVSALVVEAAAALEGNLAAWSFLTLPPQPARSLYSNAPLEIQDSVLQFLHTHLTAATAANRAKRSMELWHALTLLMGPRLLVFSPTGASRLALWLDIHKQCFNAGKEAQLTAIRAWSAVAHVVARADNPSPAAFKLLLHPYTLLRIKYRAHDPHSSAILTSLHRLVCGFLHHTLAQATPRHTQEAFARVGELFVCRVVEEWYLNPNVSSPVQVELGLAVVALLVAVGRRPGVIADACLNSSDLDTECIPSVGSRGVYNNLNTFTRLLVRAGECPQVSAAQAVRVVLQVVDAVRPLLKRSPTNEVVVPATPVRHGPSSFVLPDPLFAALPKWVRAVVRKPDLLPDQLRLVVMKLIDAVTVTNLFGRSGSCIDVVLRSYDAKDPALTDTVVFLHPLFGKARLWFVYRCIGEYVADTAEAVEVHRRLWDLMAPSPRPLSSEVAALVEVLSREHHPVDMSGWIALVAKHLGTASVCEAVAKRWGGAAIIAALETAGQSDRSAAATTVLECASPALRREVVLWMSQHPEFGDYVRDLPASPLSFDSSLPTPVLEEPADPARKAADAAAALAAALSGDDAWFARLEPGARAQLREVFSEVVDRLA